MADMPFDRRTVIRAAGAVGAGAVGAGLLAACGSSGTPSTGTGQPASSTSSGSSSGTGAATSTGTAPSGVSVKVADVPVGGGVALPDQLLVVTQPSAGQFKAFNGTCTHQRCPVTKVENGQIVCPCHGSRYDITTGVPTADSPAKRPLAPKTATVNGDSVVIS